MKTAWYALMALALLAGGDVLAPVAVSAQDRARQGAPNREGLERQVRERFETLIQTELGIDDAVAQELRATMASFNEERRELGMRQMQLRRRLRSSGTLLDAGEAQAVLDEVVAVQRSEVDLLAREQEAFLQVLSPPQLVRFYTLREQLSERIRSFRGGGPPGRRGGGGSPSGPPNGGPFGG